jgi:hypothetical protein
MTNIDIDYIQTVLCPHYYWTTSNDVFTAKRFYTLKPNYTPQEFATFVENNVQQQLIDTHTITLVECGIGWDISNNEYYWAEFTIVNQLK